MATFIWSFQKTNADVYLRRKIEAITGTDDRERDLQFIGDDDAVIAEVRKKETAVIVGVMERIAMIVSRAN
jgi:hypothetical protein